MAPLKTTAAEMVAKARAAAGDALAADESSLLAQLQLAFRSNLERRRRAANTIWRAARRSTSAAARAGTINAVRPIGVIVP